MAAAWEQEFDQVFTSPLRVYLTDKRYGSNKELWHEVAVRWRQVYRALEGKDVPLEGEEALSEQLPWRPEPERLGARPGLPGDGDADLQRQDGRARVPEGSRPARRRGRRLRGAIAHVA